MQLRHHNDSFIVGKANNYEGQSTKIWHFTVTFEYSCFLWYLSFPLPLQQVISVFLSFHTSTSIITFNTSQRVRKSLCLRVCVCARVWESSNS